MFAILSDSVCDTENDKLVHRAHNHLDNDEAEFFEERLYRNIDGLLYLYVVRGRLARSPILQLAFTKRYDNEDEFIILRSMDDCKEWLTVHGMTEDIEDLLSSLDEGLEKLVDTALEGLDNDDISNS